MKTSLVIPCYDEREGIAQLCERLRLLLPRLDGPVEVVFVDDGSRDGTAEVIAREAADLPHRIEVHERNRGIAAAIATGIEAAQGTEVVTLDSDCTYDPLDVPRLLERLRSGADVVTASPYHPDGGVEGVVAWRLFLSRGLSRLYWCVLPRRLHTYTSCFRAARAEVARTLRPADPGFLGVAQFLVEAILAGHRVEEVPAVLRTRRFGQSKIRVLAVMRAHLGYLFHLLGRRLGGRSTVPLVPRNEHPRQDEAR